MVYNKQPFDDHVIYSRNHKAEERRARNVRLAFYILLALAGATAAHNLFA